MKETVVGLLFFVFIGLLLYFTVVVKGVAIVGTQETTTFDVLFKNAKYLKKGHPVVFAGQQVGTVEDIRFDPEVNRVRVTLSVKGVKIPKNAKISIVSATLFGGRAVSISRPDFWSKEYYENGGTYEGIDSEELLTSLQNLSNRLDSTIGAIQDDLVKTIENAQVATKHLAQITEKINQGDGTLGRLVNDPAMGENLKKTVANLRKVTENLAQNKGTLGRLMGDAKMGEDFFRIAHNTSEITRKINEGEGTLGRLINDSSVYQNLSRITANVDRLVAKVVRGEGTMGKLFNDEGLYQNLFEVSSNVRTITKDIVDQKGLVGRAIHDPKTGENFAQIMENLNKASASLKNIVEKIDEGRGSLGALVNSNEILDSAKRALDNLNETLGKAAKAETVVGLGYFYHDKQRLGAAKGYLRLIPSRSRYFHLGATLFFPSNKSPIDFDQQKKDDGKPFIYPDVLVAQLFYFNDTNKNPWDDITLTLRAGLLEGQVGGGIDVDFLQNLRLTLEARTAHKDKGKFNENINRYLARAYFSFKFFRYFRAYVGIDNFVENGAVSFGLTNEWYDKDIKTLVTLIGTTKN